MLKSLLRCLYCIVASLILCFFQTAIAKDDEDDDFLTSYSAKQKAKPKDSISDPLEKINRKTFFFYDNFDKYLLSNIAKTYLFIAPSLVQTKLTSLRSTLGYPVVIANSVLARDSESFGLAINRLFMHLTFGVFFAKDIATQMQIEEANLDFADVLRSFGMPNGPYFISPIGGMPGNLIDAGSFAQSFVYTPYSLSSELRRINEFRLPNTIITARADFDSIITSARKSSLDMYVTQRSFFIARADRELKQKAIRKAQKQEQQKLVKTTYLNQIYYGNKLANYL